MISYMTSYVITLCVMCHSHLESDEVAEDEWEVKEQNADSIALYMFSSMSSNIHVVIIGSIVNSHFNHRRSQQSLQSSTWIRLLQSDGRVDVTKLPIAFRCLQDVLECPWHHRDY